MALLVLTLAMSSVYSQDNTEKTKMIIEVIRHGARVPIYAAGNADWVKGLQSGDLTDVGKRQHYLLGKELVNKFKDFFGQKLAADEYYVRSSGFQRTVASAQSHLMGIWDHFPLTQLDFPNGDIRTVPPVVSQNTLNLNFRTPLPKGYIPDPIHSDTLPDDELLYFIGGNVCPIGKDLAKSSIIKIQNEVDRDPEFQKFVEQVQEVYGLPKLSADKSRYDACVELADFAYQDARVNPNPKIPTTHELYGRLTRCYQINIMGKFENPLVRKLIPTPLVKEIVGKLKHKSTATTNNPLKFQVYSGHDSTIAPILAQLGIVDLDCFLKDLKEVKFSETCTNFPEVASNLIFELVTVDNVDYIQTYYNFEPIKVCKEDNKAQKYRCRVAEYEETWNAKLSSNWRKECGVANNLVPSKPATKTSAYKTFGWILVFVAGLLFISLACLFVTLVTLPKMNNDDAKLYTTGIDDGQESTLEFAKSGSSVRTLMSDRY